MRAGCFAETRVIELLNHRFVPFFFNRGGPGKGHDEAARKFTVGKTKNKYAYLAAFKPDGTYLGETHVYADKVAVFEWLRQLMVDHPAFAKPSAADEKLFAAEKDAKGEDLLRAARLRETLGDYEEAADLHERLLKEKAHAAAASRALLRIARYRKDWTAHTLFEANLRKIDDGAHTLDADIERSYRMLAKNEYAAARAFLNPLTKRARGSKRHAEAHFNAGVACWFDGDRDWAKFHWYWIVDNLPDDRLYMRARIAAAAESMPYPNPELANFRSRGMIGTGHIVREVAKSMRIYRRLEPEYEKGGDQRQK